MAQFIEMFRQCSALSKGIILLLIVISVYCWGIMIYKWRRFSKIRKQNDILSKKIGNLPIGEIFNMSLNPSDNPIVRLVSALISESRVEQYQDNQGFTRTRRILPPIDALRERLDAEAEAILASEESRIDFLATTATVAPFLGLLGTVLGITQSFWEIGKQSSTNIAVVAPGLAEALLTTIVGLIVAIPAAIGYNWLRGYLRDMATELHHFSRHILAKISAQKS